MNISRRSWHYRLLCFFDDVVPNNLCDYAKELAICMFFCVVITVILGVTVFGAAMGLYLGVTWAIVLLHWWALLIPVAIALIVWVVRGCGSIDDSGTVQLFKEFVRAKKERYCPKIDYTE
jgi:hypothetical protein